jgi:N-acetylmuramoyl-L-alanine amidase
MSPFPRPQAIALRGLAAALLGILAACAPMPADQGRGALWQASPNHDQRRPNFVILHQTSNDNVAAALKTLTDPQRKVSAHYLIARDGTLIQLVDENARAWHAGESWWGGTSDLNSASIGIELDNTGDEPFAEAQIVRLLALLGELRERYRIPQANILAHGDIAPGRKVDPSRLFPWQRLARHGFGLWCEAPAPAAPAGFDAMLGLQALGYDTTAPGTARQAFRRHFRGSEIDAELAPDEQALLHCLLQNKLSRDLRGQITPPSGY